MPPARTPYADKNLPVNEEAVYLEMIEPHSDAEMGKKLQIGDVVRVPWSVAKRWVENVNIAKVTTRDAWEKYTQGKLDAAEARRQERAAGTFHARVANANALNANFAALSKNPDAFDPSGLPRQDPEAQAAAERRGMASRMGIRESGESLEEQIAALDQMETAKGNIPVSAGLSSQDYASPTTSDPSPGANLTAQTGAVGASGRALPLPPPFVDPNAISDDDDDDDDDEAEDEDEEIPDLGMMGDDGEGPDLEPDATPTPKPGSRAKK